MSWVIVYYRKNYSIYIDTEDENVFLDFVQAKRKSLATTLNILEKHHYAMYNEYHYANETEFWFKLDKTTDDKSVDCEESNSESESEYSEYSEYDDVSEDSFEDGEIISENFFPSSWNMSDDIRTVDSKSQPNVSYLVNMTQKSCTCPGFKGHGKCWHINAKNLEKY